ncbi:MAG: DUF6212 domain-containing protein, partial [Chloroflexi bacterium]|nr:DUF6212 domain-containing protein [Chloroflexota bacterium]
MSLASRKAIPLTLALLGLSACAPVVAEGQPHQTAWVTLAPGQSAGQTLATDYRGLSGMDLYLRPGTTSDGSLRLSLFEAPGDDTPIASARLPLASVTEPGFYHLRFDPLTDSSRRSYYLALEVDGAGDVALGSETGETYTSGALYLGNAPVDGQLTFRPLYDPPQIALGLAGEALTWALWLAVAAFLFTLPGWALLHLLHPRAGLLGWFERAALASAIGVALYPLLLLLSDLVGISAGRWIVWLVPALSLIYGASRLRRSDVRESTPSEARINRRPSIAAGLALAGIIGLISITRFFAIRMVGVPMWGDSVQ